MARPRNDAHDTATKTRLLDAAERVFGEHGYRDARLEDIARAASIKRPSLLYHYRTKADLYAAVVRHAFAEMRTQMLPAMASEGTFAERLEATVDTLLRFQREHRGLLSVILRALLDEGGDAQDVVDEELGAIVDNLVAFAETAGGEQMPRGFPLRGAVMQLLVAELCRSAMGPRAAHFFGPAAHTHTLTRALLLGDRTPFGSDARP